MNFFLLFAVSAVIRLVLDKLFFNMTVFSFSYQGRAVDVPHFLNWKFSLLFRVKHVMPVGVVVTLLP